MIAKPATTTLFLDVGGVLLTNGWDRGARLRACQKFQLDVEDVNERHHLTYDTYEVGKLSLDAYLDRLVFYEKRTFSREDFKSFMFEQSQPFSPMIDYICRLKKTFHLKVAVVSNEGRELTKYRIKQFELSRFVDFFIASSFVHFRKPDEDMYRIALDISQVSPEEVVYLDDRRMFVDVARGLGIHGVHHTGLESTRKTLDGLGLALEKKVR